MAFNLRMSVMLITGFVFSLCIVPIVCIFIIIFGPHFLVAFLKIKIKYGNKAHLASGMDIVHGKESALTSPIINILLKINGKLDMEKIRQKTLQTLTLKKDGCEYQKYEKLRMIYEREFGFTIWKMCPNFSLENHVRQVHVPSVSSEESEPGTSSNGIKSCFPEESWEAFSQRFLNAYGMLPFSKGTPKWEILVSEFEQTSYAVLFRFHHAISDGINLSRMFYEDIVDETQNPFMKTKPPSRSTRILIYFWSFALLPFGLYKMLSVHDRNPLHSTPLSGKKGFFVSDPISLADLSKIKANKIVNNASTHAIILSCISRCISNYFSKRNFEVKKITALKPFPLQSTEQVIKLENKFAVVAMDLPVTLTLFNGSSNSSSTMPSPRNGTKLLSSLDRLRLVKRKLMKSNGDRSIWAVNTVINNVCYFLPTCLAEALLSVKGCTLAISHVHGGKETTFIYGDKITSHMFWIPDRNPMGVGFSVFSYDGFLRVGLNIDLALIANDNEGEIMMADIVKEVTNLLNESEASMEYKSEKITINMDITETFM